MKNIFVAYSYDMIHNLTLRKEPFELIKSHKKIYELRLYDEKRKLIKIGDIIVFKSLANEEEISVEVIDIFRFSSFKELYNGIPLRDMGYLENDIKNKDALYKDMESYYPLEKQRKYSVVAFKIKVIN